MAEVVIADPSWWLDHPEELLDALQMAALLPERDEPTEARDDEIVLTDPGWWADHMDELRDGLARVDAERQPEWSPDHARGGEEDQHTSIDLDALRQQRIENPSPQFPPPDRDRGLER